MVFVHATPDETNCFPSKTYILNKRSNQRNELYLDKNCLNHDFVYLKENEGSCYWIDSKGLGIRFCDVGAVKDISLEDIRLILTNVLASVSSFDEEYVSTFAEELLSKIVDTFKVALTPDNTIEIFVGWKSIALLILSSGRATKAGIVVSIGPEDYRILC